ncbi:sensor histidine kinase [Marinobacter litoralis]|uniref:sensor histidine kinase n=1 Tax=Marinobacter litoralis TaxID=187981 RepID=UPI0018EC1251|nr:HAMP domain-containing sensor histidine kinase [Marinobacter litoralis]MBJ6137126.1 HAMP domain-containing histidine kinase [Marinobacter litoralis]
MTRFRFPLFWRIFLSIWLAMAVTVVASQLATRVLLDRERQAIVRQAGLQDIASEAINLREQLGRAEARRFLRMEGERLKLHLMLIEPDQSHHRLPRMVRERMQSNWHLSKPAVLDLNGGYQLIAWPRMGAGGWLHPGLFRMFELVLAFVVISMACWLVARFVSRPLRHMEGTARSIAKGDTELRVADTIARRRDEVGQLASAFNAMTDRLCQLLDRHNRLLRDISHDLRTPLARQRIAIELASDAGADPALMDSILRQNERLETMTSQILTLYRVSENGGVVEQQPVRPLSLINRVLGDASDYAEQQGVDCKMVASDDVANITILGDPGLLQRAFDNILQNALDHTPPGQSVNVGLSVSNGRVEVSIADEGAGAPEEMLKQLFEPFFRADESRGGKGWGLGLAIARDIILAHDGDVTAQNRSGSGLQVTVRLPVFFGS